MFARIAPWLDRMDRHFDDEGFNDSGLKTRPCELFKRNCWISFEPVEGSLSVLADLQVPLCGHTVAHLASRHLKKRSIGQRGASFARVAH
jgi:hypothetical protein